MLLRVYVQTREEFDRWVQSRQQPAQRSRVTRASRAARSSKPPRASTATPCRAPRPTGEFGPDLTHLMSRDTIAAGAVPNTPANLRRWIQDPGAIQAGIQNAGHGVERSGTRRG